MPEKDTLFGTKVKHKGIFDFKEIYRVLFEWLTEQEYDIEEKTYKEVVGAGGVKEIEIEWDAKKKVSDYFKNTIKIKWHIMGMKDVEVEIEGVKQKMNTGQFEIEAKGILIKDYQARWENNPFFKFLRTMYDQYLIPSRTEQYEGKLIGEVEEFIAQVKAYLQLTGKR